MEQTTTTHMPSFDDPLGLLEPFSSELSTSLDLLLQSPKNKAKGQESIGDSSNYDDGDDASGTLVSSVCNTGSMDSSCFTHCPPPEIPPMMNWVHMEVQENAKIPNLYHVPVRRSNNNVAHGDNGVNAQQKRRRDGTNKNIETVNSSADATATTVEDDTMLVDELLRLTDEDWTLTEKFLGNDHRMSAAAAYSNAGALMSSIGTKVESMMKNSDAANTNTSADDDAHTSTTDDAHTPTASEKLEINGSNPVQASDGQDEDAHIEKELNNLHYSYSYGRTVPLPLPTKRHSPPARAIKSTPIALATTLKANASSSGDSNNNNDNNNTSTNLNETQRQQQQQQQQTLSIPIINNQQPTGKPQNNVSLAKRPPSLSPSVTKTKSLTPSLLEATKKRSQFGFGGNHVVPSPVHQPLVRQLPPAHSAKSTKSISLSQIQANNKSKSSNVTTASTTSTKTTKTTIPAPAFPSSGRKYKAPAIPPPMQTHLKLSTTNVGASYERKKQRAKDARVKLNESIERLSVAINLAGGQSKQRAQAYAYWTNNGSESLSTTATSSKTNAAVSSSAASPLPVKSSSPTSSPSVQNGVTKTVTIMEEAVKTAESAKKWERPSFVGSAASMIQQLNAQCEALMREVIELKKMQNDGVLSTVTTGRNAKNEDLEIVSVASQSIDDNGKRSPSAWGNSGGDSKNVFEPHLKRLKAYHEEQTVTINDIIKRDRIIVKIGSFLDPGSILRFMCVSKSWQVQLDPAMKSDSIWSPLCVQRFGAYSVREWLNDQDEESTGSTQISHMNLYRQMSDSNVKPKCHFEGNLHLGGGKIDNVACGWVSVVERSNGETLRSVLTSVGGEIKYVSFPVVELRILIQNIGIADTAIEIPDQIISVDASTRRRGEEMFEITSDNRMLKKVYRADGSIFSPIANSVSNGMNQMHGNLVKLRLFETAVLSVSIHARACPTTTKFRQRANFAKTLLNVRGTTVPLVIPIIGPKR